MTVSPGDIVRVTLEYDMGANGIAQNILHWRYDGANILNDTQALDQWEAYANAWGAEWALNASDTFLLNSVKVSVKNILNEYLSIGERAIFFPGGSGQDALPPGNAGLFRIPVVASKGQGRTFVPGFVSSVQAGGFWEVAPLLSLAVLAALRTDDPSSIPGVVNSWSGGVDVKGGFGIRLFSGSPIINVIVAYQRRRKAGVGE